MNPEELAAEAASIIYYRYINAGQWTKTGTLTQGEFCNMMACEIKSTIEKAYNTGLAQGYEKRAATEERLRAAASPAKCGHVFINGICTQCGLESPATEIKIGGTMRRVCLKCKAEFLGTGNDDYCKKHRPATANEPILNRPHCEHDRHPRKPDSASTGSTGEKWTVKEDTYTAILYHGNEEIYRVSRNYKHDLERIAYRANATLRDNLIEFHGDQNLSKED